MFASLYCCALSCKALATKQYASMVHTLLKKAQGGEDGGAIEKISNEMLNGLSNLLLASSVSYSDSSQETADREIAEVGWIVYVVIRTHPYTCRHTYTYG